MDPSAEQHREVGAPIRPSLSRSPARTGRARSEIDVGDSVEALADRIEPRDDVDDMPPLRWEDGVEEVFVVLEHGSSSSSIWAS